MVMAGTDKIDREATIKGNISEQANQFVQQKGDPAGGQPYPGSKECHQHHAKLSRLDCAGVLSRRGAGRTQASGVSVTASFVHSRKFLATSFRHTLASSPLASRAPLGFGPRGCP